ncbi:MAG: HAD hydrolase family protein [Elusimicrobia bacterium]|nr:HAD hydrolase family protein [Elusimicrobiota bacterium]
MNKTTIIQKAQKIKIVLMDVDGVLTDGKMYFIPGPGGEMTETKGFSAIDGIGLRLLRYFGIQTGVITGRKSAATRERVKIAGMKYCYEGFLSKLIPFEKIMACAGFSPEEAAYIGDDWTDIPVLHRVGLACAPQNALPEVKKAAHYICKTRGGEGAAREVCDLILKSQGHWDDMMRLVETATWASLPKEELIIEEAQE